MKRILALLFALFCFVQITAQSQNYGFNLKQGFILFQNNFFLEQSLQKTFPKTIENSEKPILINVFGEKLNIYALEKTPNDVTFCGYNLAKDSINIENLQYRIIKNNNLLKDWSEVLDKRVQNILIKQTTLRGKSYLNINARTMLSDSLRDKDVLQFELRKKSGEIVAIYLFRKKTDDEVPFIMGINDNVHPKAGIAEFLIELMDKKNNNPLFDYSFYKDWPSTYQAKFSSTPRKVSRDTKIAIFFRPKDTANVKNMLEYRMLENGRVPKVWQKADDVIVLYDFKPGVQYTLQVRYKGAKKYIQEKYYTLPEWYQMIWVKVLIVFLLMALGGLGYYLLKNRNERRKRREQSARIQALTAQLNPHFIFNALNSIQALVNGNHKDKTIRYLTDFSRLMRSIVDNGEKNFIPLSQDIKALNHYISLEQLRFTFQYTFEQDQSLAVDDIEVLPFLVQTILENSVKHGVSAMGEDGKIILKIYRQGRNLIYEISDNGKGYDISQKTTGKGIELTRERIAIFNNSSKYVKIEMKTENKGSRTIIIYKNLLSND